MSSSREAISRLVERAYQNPWDPLTALPWATKVDLRALRIPDEVSLAANVPAYRKLTPKQKERLKQHELISHLSSLAYGELKAMTLAGETSELTPEDREEELWFLGCLMADEGKHFFALKRYLNEKAKHSYEPHPSLPRVFESLSREKDHALNLFVGQVLLEGAAASLLGSLLLTVKEPLLKRMLQLITLDETRHMKFADWVSRERPSKMSPARRRRMEEILFEGAVGGAASLIAVGPWRELGMSRTQATRGTVTALKDRGVLPFYTRVLAKQLEQRGFPAEALRRRLETQLEAELRLRT